MRKKKLVTSLCGILFTAAITSAFLPSISIADSKSSTISIDKKHFPDSEFRGLVKDKFDKNHDGKLSVKERRAVKEFDTEADSDEFGDTDDGPYTYGIKNPQGIEYFTELRNIYFEFSSVKTIDMTKNPKLKTVTFFDQFDGLKKVVMLEGQTLIISYMEDEQPDSMLFPGNKLYCKSSDSSVVKVSRIAKNSKCTLVTAKKAGKTKIKFTNGGSCTITVKARTTTKTSKTTTTTPSLTPLANKQALTAITNYLNYEQGLDDDSCGGAPCYWDINKFSSNKKTAVVYFRAYTSAFLNYYIDRSSGYTYETIEDMGTEKRTGVTFNARDYLNLRKH